MDAISPTVDTSSDKPLWRPERCSRIALILQGGGALGAYQAGVYEAMHEAGIEPDWVTGVSIGAINSALIAGNPRERRLGRLRDFWNRVTTQDLWPTIPDGNLFREARNTTSALMTMLFGQPGFFTPNLPDPFAGLPGRGGQTAYYDTTPLRATLNELVDFDRINRRTERFAVGAVHVTSGNFVYFDNADDKEITAEHVMASGALPPAFPAVRIGTDSFWDGGIVSNTPLQHLLDHEDGRNALVFQVDLFSARGPLPKDLQAVMGRQKDIMYSSRTRYNTDVYKMRHELKSELFQALKKIPTADLTDQQRKRLEELRDLPEMTILHLIYQQKPYEGQAKDYEVSAASMRDHWKSGYDDTHRTLQQRSWLELPPEGGGVRVHDVHRLTNP